MTTYSDVYFLNNYLLLVTHLKVFVETKHRQTGLRPAVKD
jgi:hypothetical protein